MPKLFSLEVKIFDRNSWNEIKNSREKGVAYADHILLIIERSLRMLHFDLKRVHNAENFKTSFVFRFTL